MVPGVVPLRRGQPERQCALARQSEQVRRLRRPRAGLDLGEARAYELEAVSTQAAHDNVAAHCRACGAGQNVASTGNSVTSSGCTNSSPSPVIIARSPVGSRQSRKRQSAGVPASAVAKLGRNRNGAFAANPRTGAGMNARRLGFGCGSMVSRLMPVALQIPASANGLNPDNELESECLPIIMPMASELWKRSEYSGSSSAILAMTGATAGSSKYVGCTAGQPRVTNNLNARNASIQTRHGGLRCDLGISGTIQNAGLDTLPTFPTPVSSSAASQPHYPNPLPWRLHPIPYCPRRSAVRHRPNSHSLAMTAEIMRRFHSAPHVQTTARSPKSSDRHHR